jgi:hypothetical protein
MRQTVAKWQKSALCGGGARSTPHPGWGASSRAVSRSVGRKPAYQGLAGVSLDEAAGAYLGATSHTFRSQPQQPRPSASMNGEIEDEAIQASVS